MIRQICFFMILVLFAASLSGCNPIKSLDPIPEYSEQQEAESSDEQDYKERVSRSMDDFFKTLEIDNHFSGYILVGTQDEIVYAGGNGYSDFELKLENNIKTKFKVASISKQFIATAIMQLQEKGKININDKLSKYIPEFPHSDKITIHQLLTHGSGLETDASDYDIRNYIPREDKKTATGAKRSKDVALLFNPGDEFNYSNVGYILLSYVVEKVSNQDIDIYFKENIFDPLEMTGTGFINPDTIISNFAVGYLNGEQAFTSPDKYLFKVDQDAASGFYSCAEDLYKWNLELHSGKILKPETRDKMLTRYNNNYGYGWNIYGDSPNPITYAHDGNTKGYTSKLIKTSEGVSIIILSNYDIANLAHILDNIILILVD